MAFCHRRFVEYSDARMFVKTLLLFSTAQYNVVFINEGQGTQYLNGYRAALQIGSLKIRAYLPKIALFIYIALQK